MEVVDGRGVMIVEGHTSLDEAECSLDEESEKMKGHQSMVAIPKQVKEVVSDAGKRNLSNPKEVHDPTKILAVAQGISPHPLDGPSAWKSRTAQVH